MKKILSISLLASALALSACGGGGSGDEPGFADAYVGSWKGCIYIVGDYYTNRTRVFAKGGPDSMNFAVRDENRYSDASCNNLTTTENFAGSLSHVVKLTNTLNFQGRAGHEGTVTHANGTTEIFYISVLGNELRVGGGLANGVFSGWASPYFKQ